MKWWCDVFQQRGCSHLNQLFWDWLFQAWILEWYLWILATKCTWITVNRNASPIHRGKKTLLKTRMSCEQGDRCSKEAWDWGHMKHATKSHSWWEVGHLYILTDYFIHFLKAENIQGSLFTNISSKSSHIWRRRPLWLCFCSYSNRAIGARFWKVQGICSICQDKWGLKILQGIEKIITRFPTTVLFWVCDYINHSSHIDIYVLQLYDITCHLM